jgi:hypothetical protein
MKWTLDLDPRRSAHCFLLGFLFATLGLASTARAFEAQSGDQEASGTFSLANPPRIVLDDAVEVVYRGNALGCKKKDGKAVASDHADIPARAFKDFRGQVHLLASSRRNYELVGPSLDEVARRDCHQLMTGAENPDPSAFDLFHWLSAVYTEDGKHIFGLSHQEYHGEQRYAECRNAMTSDGKRRRHCWYTSINLFTSSDGGSTFAPSRAQSRPLAMLPYPFSTDMDRAGPHSPTNIVRNPRDGRYYFLFFESPYGDQRQGMCVMRARRLDFSDARVWGGGAFDVTFADPYSAGAIKPEEHLCTPVVPWLARSLTYNVIARAFLLLGSDQGQVIYSWSQDLVHWSTPQNLMQAMLPPAALKSGSADAFAYFSFLDAASMGLSFETTSESFYLYYTHYTERNRASAAEDAFRHRDLLRRKVTLSMPRKGANVR